MKDKVINFIKPKPVFVLLLPVFFFLHGFTENYNFIPAKEAAYLTFIFIVCSLALTVLFWLLYRDHTKAALASFAFITFNFFFGSVHDFLKNIFPNTFIIRYIFILPLVSLLSIVLIIYLYKTKRRFTRITKYLNLLFILLILIDAGTLLFKSTKQQGITVAPLYRDFITCDTCDRPDIYLIIADEYAGKIQLKDIFSFDNLHFERQLQQRGFYISENSKSNYNLTVYSMASLLNMDYLKNLNRDTANQQDVLNCRKLINKNNVLDFFKSNGYDIYNYSFFYLDNKPNLVSNIFFTSNISFVMSQTFLKRFNYDLGSHFASKQTLLDIAQHNLFNDEKVDSLTRKIVLKKTARPKFVYAHLGMPHHPYYFDSLGKAAGYEDLSDDNKFNKKAYIDYLLYTNKILLSLVDHIKDNSEQPPIILLMSDHGFRQIERSVDKKYVFMNLNSTFFPDGNYTGLYDGMSNVNQFRIVLNTQFGQKFPFLTDSTIYLRD